MTPAEIAAYVGAAAWLPQIAGWAYRRFIKPVLLVVPGDAEIGFSRFGPIFNARIAFAVERKDIVIDDFGLTLRHEDGQVHRFRWYGLAEEFSEITDDAGNRSIIKRDQSSPIALKIGTESLIEKFVRFQEPKFHEEARPLWSSLVAHFNFLKQGGKPGWVEDVLSSKELHAVVHANQSWFWWRAGKYELAFEASSPKKFTFSNAKFMFELSQLDLDHLKPNINTIEQDVKDAVRSNLPEFKRDNPVWNWANVQLRRAS